MRTSQETCLLFDWLLSILNFEFSSKSSVHVFRDNVSKMAFYQNVQVRLNRDGGIYDNGRRHSQLLRERVLDLHHTGMSQQTIAREVKSSRHFVQNVLRDYDLNNSSMPVRRAAAPRSKTVEDVIEFLENEKLCKPSIGNTELQQRLLLDGIVHHVDLPSKSAISKCIREDLVMTKKKIHQVPLEARTPINIEHTNFFLDQVSDLPPTSVHFFDESSVLKTTMNRRYGNAPLGEPAFEVQRYASNANYTINLLHSMQGIDHVNILDGASNGNELLFFFEEALSVTKADGSAVLERGDTVIMDNCGFHHSHFAEPILRDMLHECGINLLYQPPYSPHFNTCEFCFRQMKAFLNRHQELAENQTEYSIFLACEQITAQNSLNIFRNCGYIL